MMIDVSDGMEGQRLIYVNKYIANLRKTYFEQRSKDGLPINFTIIPFNDEKKCINVHTE